MSQIQQIDYSVDILKALLWEYNKAINLQTLLEQKQDWYNENQRDFWNNWYDDVFNLQTANEFGLAVWAIILQLSIAIQSTPVTPSRPTWGFEQYHRNFNRGNFFSGKGGVQVLTPDNARLALRLRYFQITCRPTVTEINRILHIIFGDLGTIYVQDNLDMTVTYKFDFTPNAQLFAIIQQFDLFMRPSAVSATYVRI